MSLLRRVLLLLLLAACCCYLSLAHLQSTKLLSSPHLIASPNSNRLIGQIMAFEGMLAHTHQRSTDPLNVSSGLISIFRNHGSPLRASAHLPNWRSQLLSCFRSMIEHLVGVVTASTLAMS